MSHVFNGFIDVSSKLDALALFFARLLSGSLQPSGKVTLGSNGSYTFTIQLQASRDGNDKDGRQYIITVSTQDNAGNKGSAATGVIVPHDQGT